jgi:hypothetical protein
MKGYLVSPLPHACFVCLEPFPGRKEETAKPRLMRDIRRTRFRGPAGLWSNDLVITPVCLQEKYQTPGVHARKKSRDP